jgi:hypothetical protein
MHIRACLIALAFACSANAQDTKIAFQLDWRFEGPAAMFLLPKAKGYFAAEKLGRHGRRRQRVGQRGQSRGVGGRIRWGSPTSRR